MQITTIEGLRAKIGSPHPSTETKKYTALNEEVYSNDEQIKNWNDSFSKNEEGMLIIDIVNLENNSIVWRGWKKNVLKSANLEEGINEAVHEILSEFPPENPMGLGQ